MSNNILPFEIARRYLFAKKSQNVINIISGISALGVMVATAALVIVLSVFNGLNGLVTSLFGTFDPDLKIVPTEGKSFVLNDTIRTALDETEGVFAWSEVVEDNALVRYGKRQVPATIMGVGPNYNSVTDIDSIVYEGRFRKDQCLVGAILADQLAMSIITYEPYITIYAPKRLGKVNLQNPENSFIERNGRVCGTFMVQQSDYDGNYIMAGINTARELFSYDNSEVTSISIRIDSLHTPSSVANTLRKKIGSSVDIKDKWQQHESFFKMMEVEKFMSFFILLFIVLIAAFNIIGSLSMLIFEKKESISVLRSMGADEPLVTKIFLFEGWLVSVGGALLGLILGIALVLAQETWGIIGFGGDDSYIISAYPVDLQWADVALVFIAVIILAVLAAWYPVRSIVHRYYEGS